MKLIHKLFWAAILVHTASSCAPTYKVGASDYSVITVINSERDAIMNKMVAKGWLVDRYIDVTAEGDKDYGITTYWFTRKSH